MPCRSVPRPTSIAHVPGHSAEEIRQNHRGHRRYRSQRRIPGAAEKPGVPPPLSREVIAPIEALSREMLSGVAVIPDHHSGATDGRFLTPGASDVWRSGMLGDGATAPRRLNERIRVQSLIEGREFLYRLAKAYAGGK